MRDPGLLFDRVESLPDFKGEIFFKLNFPILPCQKAFHDSFFPEGEVLVNSGFFMSLPGFRPPSSSPSWSLDSLFGHELLSFMMG